LIIIAAVGMLALGGYYSWQQQKLTEIGISSESAKQCDYIELSNRLFGAGFTNITLNEINDLAIDEISKENKVAKVSIGEETTFSASDKFPYDIDIVIDYHTITMIGAPADSKSFKGLMSETAQALFENAGFVNVVLEPHFDLYLGWLKQVGEIKSVTINGADDFQTTDMYRPDAEVIIQYHDMKKK
jgi:hypothetical protein